MSKNIITKKNSKKSNKRVNTIITLEGKKIVRPQFKAEDVKKILTKSIPHCRKELGITMKNLHRSLSTKRFSFTQACESSLDTTIFYMMSEILPKIKHYARMTKYYFVRSDSYLVEGIYKNIEKTIQEISDYLQSLIDLESTHFILDQLYNHPKGYNYLVENSTKINKSSLIGNYQELSLDMAFYVIKRSLTVKNVELNASTLIKLYDNLMRDIKAALVYLHNLGGSDMFGGALQHKITIEMEDYWC